MAGMSRLQQTPKGYRHRWTRPRDLVELFPQSEIRCSLGTKVEREAELRNAEAIKFMNSLEARARTGQSISREEIDTGFALIRLGLPHDPQAYAVQLARRWAVAMRSEKQHEGPYYFLPVCAWFASQGEPVAPALRESVERAAQIEVYYMSRAYKTQEELSVIRQSRGEYAPHDGTPTIIRQYSSVHTPGIDRTKGMKLSKLGAIWKRVRKPKRTSSYGFDKSFSIWKELHGDTPVSEITIDMVDEYVDFIQKLPDRRFGVYRKLSPRQAIEKANQLGEKHRLEHGGIVRLTGLLSAAVGVLVPRRLSLNPFDGALNNIVSNARKKKPFSPEQLQKLFGEAPYVHPFPNDRGARWWLPVVLIYTGARREEIAQLSVRDIKKKQGIWYFNITDSLDDEESIDEGEYEDIGKSIKNQSSERIVPIHDELIRLGFLDHVSAMKSYGHDRIWPELKKNKNDLYGGTVGGGLNDWMKKAGKHSSLKRLRNTVVSKLISAEVNGDVRRALCGHSDGMGRSDVHYKYYSDFDIVTLHKNINKLSYDFNIGI
jgi:integrase